MSNYKIENLFPKPLLVMDNVCLEQLLDFELLVNDIMKTHGTGTTDFQYVKSTHTTFNNMYDLRQFQPLVREIQNAAYIFLETIGYNADEIANVRLKQLWANIAGNGNYLFPHTHSNSIVSGAFYVKAGPDDYIQFYNDLTDTIYMPNSAIDNRVAEYKCEAGRLMLFKSNLLHGNVIKKDMTEKIVMSFNIGF